MSDWLIYRTHYFNQMHVAMAKVLCSWTIYEWFTSRLWLSDFKERYRNRFSMHTQNAFDSESTPFVPMDMRSSPFMSGSWEVYEWLMSKQWVTTATQCIILNFFTIFNYQQICHKCFRANTMTLLIHIPLLRILWRAAIYQIHEWPRYIRFMSDCAEYHSRRRIW